MIAVSNILLSLLLVLYIKSNGASVWKKKLGGINPADIHLQNLNLHIKTFEGFLLVGFSYLFYAPAELVSVSTKSNSIISCGQLKFSLCANSQREMLMGSYFLRLTTRTLLTGKLDLIDAPKET